MKTIANDVIRRRRKVITFILASMCLLSICFVFICCIPTTSSSSNYSPNTMQNRNELQICSAGPYLYSDDYVKHVAADSFIASNVTKIKNVINETNNNIEHSKRNEYLEVYISRAKANKKRKSEEISSIESEVTVEPATEPTTEAIIEEPCVEVYEEDIYVEPDDVAEEYYEEIVYEEVVDEYSEADSEQEVFEDYSEDVSNEEPVQSSWSGPVLTAWAGVVQGPSGKETWYNYNMSLVIKYMNDLGYYYDYWVRNDGVKMFGPYVMVAANLNIRPKGTIVDTSLGLGMVCDTGSFAASNIYQLDIAVNW